MNPVFRFLYSNMNYHLEHHIFPTVPYHALPALHDEIAAHLPAPNTSVLAAYREIVDALRHQRHDPEWEIPGRRLPEEVPVGTVPAIDVMLEGSPVGTVPAMATATVTGGALDLGPAGRVAPGGIVRVDTADSTYVLCRPDVGTYVLLDGMCTHAQTHLADGLLVDGCIECPKHNGRFDVLTGQPTRRPVKVPLGTYPVECVDGRLVADVSTRAPADAV